MQRLWGLALGLTLLTGCVAADGSAIIVLPAREYYSIYLAGARDACFKTGIEEFLRLGTPLSRIMITTLAVHCETKARQLLEERLIPVQPEQIPIIPQDTWQSRRFVYTGKQALQVEIV